MEGSFDAAKGFDPSKLKTWLKGNAAFLKANVAPDVSQRLHALADLGYFGKRFLDEVNPSGTAASIKAMIEPGTFMQKLKTGDVLGAVTGEVTGRVSAATKQRQAVRSVNKLLGTEVPTAGDNARKLLRALPGTSSTIESGKHFQRGAAAVRGVTDPVSRGLPAKASASQEDQEVKAKPQKGPEKWATDGLKS